MTLSNVVNVLFMMGDRSMSDLPGQDYDLEIPLEDITIQHYDPKKPLPICPRCNYHHRLTKESKYRMDKCPYCNCPLHFSLIEGDYVL